MSFISETCLLPVILLIDSYFDRLSMSEETRWDCNSSHMNLGQVYTKPIVANYMVSLFGIDKKDTVLDPCFGTGVFLHSLSDAGFKSVIGVELDTNSYNVFNREPHDFCLINGDFFQAFDNTRQFKGIIMNPPYIRQEELDDLLPLGVSKRIIQDICAYHSYGKANIYIYFILRSIQLLEESGELIAIFPNAWEKTPSGKRFKEHLSTLGSITLSIQVKGAPFVGDPAVEVMIMKFVKKTGLPCEFKRIVIIDNQLNEERCYISTDNSSNELIELGSIAQIKRGLSTGANDIFINPPLESSPYLKSIICSPRKVEGFSTATARVDKALLLPHDVPVPDIIATYLTENAEMIKRSGKPKALLYEIEKGREWYRLNDDYYGDILFPYIIRNNIRFIFNDAHLIARDNFYLINTAISAKLLFALLNNYYVYSQLEECGKTYGNGILKIQKYDVDHILIPNPGRISKQDRRKLLGLAVELRNSGRADVVERISSILSSYYGKQTNIKQHYYNQKVNRLGHERV